MKHFWTRFHPSYPRTIIYMLQSSEYNIGNYFIWLNRTKNFLSVTRRRNLDYTIKASLLLVTAWLILLCVYTFVIYAIIKSIISMDILIALLGVVLFMISPMIVAFGITIPLFIGHKLIQEPKQRKTLKAASDIILKHSAIKIAIAGSYGKTTAKEILQTVLSETKKVAHTPGNINTPIGISRFIKKLDHKEDVIIFELGEERVGDVRKLCELTKPDIGVITGINEAHLSSFGTLELTTATIFELKGYLGDKPLYKNTESLLVKAEVTDGDKLAFSRKGVNGWHVSDIKTSIIGTKFVAQKDDKIISASTGLLGEHNIGTILVAVDIADSIGLTSVQIEAGINKTKPFEHRMQPKFIHGAWVIDDTYNGNSEGVQAGLLLLKSLDAKRRIYITPGLVEQGIKTKEVHEKIGRQIAKVADVVVLMNNSVTDYILAGLKESGFDGKLIIADDPLKFYSNLDAFVAAGDVVLMQNDWTDNYA